MHRWYLTGRWFAGDHWGFTPDILTMAEGCTGADTPVGITATTRAIRDCFSEGFLSQGHTYSMHPLMVAAIPDAIEEYRKLEVAGRLRRPSAHRFSQLEAVINQHRCIGDVRGGGHFWAVELMKNRETKKPFNTRADKAGLKSLTRDRLSSEVLNGGPYLLSSYNHLMVAPLLTTTEDEVNEGLETLSRMLEMADRETE